MELLRPLTETPIQGVLTDRLQVADVLRWILEQTGAAEVRMTSFSISEEFLRRIYLMKREGLIRSLEILLDLKATHKTLVLWPFIRQVVERCHLGHNHSKLLLIENGGWKVAAMMSQNLTRGNRHESYTITTDGAVYGALAGQLEELIRTDTVPFNDVFARTTADSGADGVAVHAPE